MSSHLPACILCGQSHPGSVFYGDMLQKDDISVHQFCLLFSYKLYADKDKDVDDKIENTLEAYDLQTVKEYVAKSEKQLCMFCNKAQATICCQSRSCNKRFHFKCGFDSERCVFKFDGLFYAYCPIHSRKTKEKPTPADSCVICLTDMKDLGPFGTINLNCRPFVWMHRACAIQLAAYRGYEFQCPLCGDLKAFQKYIVLRGVFIPQKDNLTQAHNVAYQETQTKYCEAEICLLSQSKRDPRAEDKLLSDGVSSIKCGYCGKMFHKDCGEKQGTYENALEEDKEKFICSSCMDLSDHELSVSSAEEEESELNNGFDLGSVCGSLTLVAFSQQEEEREGVDSNSETQIAKRYKFENHYQWKPCHGYHNKEWRQFKLNLFMNTLRPGVKRKRGVD